MQCRNHPGVAAVDRCAGCSETFCGNCLVEIHGQRFCASCKVMALRGRRVGPARARRLCTEARDALIISVVGVLFCPIILEIVALVKAGNARKAIQADASLAGGGMATMATIYAVLALILWAIGFYMRTGT